MRECLVALMKLRKRSNGIRELVPLGRSELRAEGIVTALSLFTQDAPLAAVINAGDARHAEEQAVDERQMPFFL